MHYRDDQAALEARRDDLRQEIADLRKAEALDAAVRDQEAAERELAALEARLAHMQARRAPLLENVRVASPCTASWEAMEGDERVRFCGECRKNVYNLSAMAREEAERLLAEREGSICVRLYRRADGTVLTSDCSVGVRRKRVRLAVASVAGAGALAAAATVYARTHGGLRDDTVMMGAVGPSTEDRYVPLPLPVQPEAGVVLVYWNEIPGPQRVTERWKVHADGHVVHEVEGGPDPRTAAVPAPDAAAVAAVLALAREVGSYANGISYGYEDSAIHTGFALYGNGKRPATHADTDQIIALLGALMR